LDFIVEILSESYSLDWLVYFDFINSSVKTIYSLS